MSGGVSTIRASLLLVVLSLWLNHCDSLTSNSGDGREKTIMDCGHSDWDKINCSHSSDVSCCKYEYEYEPSVLGEQLSSFPF